MSVEQVEVCCDGLQPAGLLSFVLEALVWLVCGCHGLGVGLDLPREVDRFSAELDSAMSSMLSFGGMVGFGVVEDSCLYGGRPCLQEVVMLLFFKCMLKVVAYGL